MIFSNFFSIKEIIKIIMLQENILFFPNEDTNVHLEINELENRKVVMNGGCLLYTSPSPRD